MHIQKFGVLALAGVASTIPSLTHAESCVTANDTTKTVYWGTCMYTPSIHWTLTPLAPPQPPPMPIATPKANR